MKNEGEDSRWTTDHQPLSEPAVHHARLVLSVLLWRFRPELLELLLEARDLYGQLVLCTGEDVSSPLSSDHAGIGERRASSSRPDQIAMTRPSQLACREDEKEEVAYHLLDKVRTDELKADIEDSGKGILVADTDKVASKFLGNTDVFACGGRLEGIAP